MKQLSIIRHGKAERPEGYPDDFERPLTARGRKDIGRIGAVVVRLEPPVDYVLSSPATRSAQTATRLTEVVEIPGNIVWSESAYLATAATLLNLLREIPESHAHAVLVGHNPGLEELASGLCAGSPETASIRMPTGTVAHVELDISRWSLLRWGAGHLKLLVTPKSLK